MWHSPSLGLISNLLDLSSTNTVDSLVVESRWSVVGAQLECFCIPPAITVLSMSRGSLFVQKGAIAGLNCGLSSYSTVYGSCPSTKCCKLQFLLRKYSCVQSEPVITRV